MEEMLMFLFLAVRERTTLYWRQGPAAKEEEKWMGLREKEVDMEIRMEYVSTRDQIANMFMKPLLKDTFEYL